MPRPGGRSGLRWGTARSQVLCLDARQIGEADADLGRRGTWVHWVLFNLPAQTLELEADVPTTETLGNGAKQGKNDFSNIGYGGLAPPKGKAHRYFFKLYALAVALDLASGATKAQLEAAMKGHVLAEGQLMGTYQR